MKRLWILAAFWLLPGSAAAATVAEVAAAKSPHFGSALAAAGLSPLLKAPGPYTLFVPNAEAFDQVPERFKRDPERLKALMTYHLMPGKVSAEELRQMHAAKTVNGKELKVEEQGGILKVGKAKVLGAPTEADNGLVYGIDAVLMP